MATKIPKKAMKRVKKIIKRTSKKLGKPDKLFIFGEYARVYWCSYEELVLEIPYDKKYVKVYYGITCNAYEYRSLDLFIKEGREYLDLMDKIDDIHTKKEKKIGKLEKKWKKKEKKLKKGS